MNIHYARQLSFAQLFAALQDAYSRGLIVEVADGNNLVLFYHAPDCEDWPPICRIATGLIIDSAAEEVVATPFPKLFEVNDKRVKPPSTDWFRTLEMLPGEMVTVFFHHGEWCAAGTTAFDTDESKWCWEALFGHDVLTRVSEGILAPGATYLFNVVDRECPVLVGVYGPAGAAMGPGELRPIAGRLHLRTAYEYVPNNLVDLLERVKRLPATDPGFVLLYDDGERRALYGHAWKAAQKARDGEAEPT